MNNSRIWLETPSCNGLVCVIVEKQAVRSEPVSQKHGELNRDLAIALGIRVFQFVVIEVPQIRRCRRKLLTTDCDP